MTARFPTDWKLLSWVKKCIHVFDWRVGRCEVFFRGAGWENRSFHKVDIFGLGVGERYVFVWGDLGGFRSGQKMPPQQQEELLVFSYRPLGISCGIDALTH